MSNLKINYAGQEIDVLDLMASIKNHPSASEYSAWFNTYYADLTGEGYMGRYLRFLRGFLAMVPGGVGDKAVLDAGCGFGIMSTLMALMGARSVDGVDCHEGMIHTFATYLGTLPWDLPVRPQVGDVGDMPYDDASFDLIVSHEAISHYPDVPAFVSESHRVLKPGGVLLLSDSNNSLNRRVREETLEIWRAFEQGPKGAEVHGHTIQEPFLIQRQEIIAERFGELEENEVQLLSEHTSGLAGDEITQAVTDYQSTGKLPGHLFGEGRCPVDPVQGYYIEYLFDPNVLCDDLREAGFEPQVRAYLGGARGGLLHLANKVLTCKALSPLVLPFSQAFQIMAVKR